MVLINETKYACQSCIKGHRSSGCTHTDRPLFEIKKKGRPPTQCSHCRELRRTKQVHVKCMCEAPSSTIASSSSNASVEPVTGGGDYDASMSMSGGESSSSAAPSAQPKPKTKKKKKDVTLAPPTFPNGLKDFHEMTTAAEALTGLLGGPSAATVVKNEKASVTALLNPCMCRAGGGCECCTDKKKKKPAKDDGPSSSTTGGGCCSSKSNPPPPSSSTYSSRNTSTDNFAEALQSSIQMKNTLPVSLRNFHPSSSTPGSGSHTPSSSRHLPPNDELSHIHPAHTSRHVHKTQLYSPYRGGANSHLPQSNAQPSRSVSQSRRASSAVAPSVQMAPMKSLNEKLSTFVRAQEESLLRTTNGGTGEELDGFEGFGGGVSLPPFEMFLRGGKDGEGVMMSGCMCGDGCACPNCVQHGNMEVDEEGEGSGEHKDCPPSCSSCFNCTAGFALPPDVSNIQDLIARCASELPAPPPARQNSTGLDATNLSILPPTAWASKESKEAFGLLEVPKLECCSGRCQCPPGDCSCMKDCCGCCGGCGCDEEGDASAPDTQAAPASQDLSQPTASTSSNIAPEQPAAMPSSCCSGKPPVAAANTNPSPPPAVPSVLKAPAKASSTPLAQSHKASIHKKPAKSDHHRPIGSHEQPPPIKSLSRSNSTVSKTQRPHLPKSISSGVFSNGSETGSPTTHASPLEFPGSSFARDRSGSSASRSSLAPSPSRSGSATPNSQAPSPHLRPESQASDFESLRDEALRQDPFFPSAPSISRYNTSSSSSSTNHANEELFELQNNRAPPNAVPAGIHPQMPITFRSYEEFVAASNLHQHTLMQEQQRLREEREEQQKQALAASQGMFPLDEEVEAQLKAILGGTGPSSSSNSSSTSFPTFGVNAPYSNVPSSSVPRLQQQQSNEDFINQSAFEPNFDFDPPSPRRGHREFSPMQFDQALGNFASLDDFGLSQEQGQGQEGTGEGSFDAGANFPAQAADFMLNFTAPTPAPDGGEEAPEVEGPAGERVVENVTSPGAFNGLDFDPVAFLQDALANQDYLSFDTSTTTETHGQEASSGSSSEGTNGVGVGEGTGGGGLGVDPLGFDSYDPNEFDFSSFAKDSPTHWLPDELRSPTNP